MSQQINDEELIRKYRPKQPSLLRPLVSIAIVVLLGVYIFGAIFSRDALWFWPYFDAQPSRIVVHCYGQDIPLDAQSPHLSALASLVKEQLSGSKRWDQLTLSDVGYYRANPDVLTVDLYYPQLIRIHSFRVFFSNINNLLIPLDAANAHTYPVFGMKDDFPAWGALHVETTQPIVDYLKNSGLCVIKQSRNEKLKIPRVFLESIT